MAHPFGYFLSLPLLRFTLFIHCECIFFVFHESIVTVAELKSVCEFHYPVSLRASLHWFLLSFPVAYFE